MKPGLLLILLALMATTATARPKPVAPPEPVPPPALPASIDGLPVGPIPQQQLPSGSCAAFLWAKTASNPLIMMIAASPPLVRYAPGGVVGDLAQRSSSGAPIDGIYPQASYAGADARVDIDLTIVERLDLKDGALVQGGTVTITQTGKDGIVVPVDGLIGCG